MGRGDYYGGWAPYVPVARRRAMAVREATRRLKKGQSLSAVAIAGRKITTTFWGNAWCENLEQYSDYANRLPRGKTYVRNGSVIDLRIEEGHVIAIVAGSSPYDVTIKIKKLPDATWKRIRKDCSTSIHSVIDLMRGKLPETVLKRLSDKADGLFPSSHEISLACDCPDGAKVCKHIAAVMYGIGNRLDSQPELFFKLRGVNQLDLISESVSGKALGLDQTSTDSEGIDAGDLEAIFGIDLNVKTSAPKKKANKKTAKKVAKTKVVKQEVKKKVTKKVVVAKAAKKKTVKRAGDTANSRGNVKPPTASVVSRG